MTEKRTPSYSLVAVQTAFASVQILNRTYSAIQGAEALGMDDAAVVAAVQSLTMADFDKSMTSHADNTVWQDVYKPLVNGKRLYVKFTVNARKDLLLISFKET